MGNIGGVQSGTVPATAAAGPEPLSQMEVHDLKATGFKFADKGGVSWDQWIDSARISKDPAVRAQYNELVELAGGRTDNASIKLVMERAQLMAVASRPGATASDQLAAMRGWEEQLTSALKFTNPVDLLTSPVELAAQYLANSPGVASTEWGQSLQTVLKTAGQVRAFREGVAEGIWEGGKSLVVGVVSMAAKTLRYGADSSMLGWAGDRLRGVTGRMPDWLEATVPSEKRGDATNAAISDMASGIKNYLANHTPAQVAGDIGTAIGKAWDGLKADHAKAAAQGPEAEARWWGKTIGRVGFEVAATFVPVAGQAGKVSTVARGADVAADGVRAADKLADVGRGAEAARTAEKMDGVIDLLSQAKRKLGSLPLNSKTLDDLFRAGKMSMDEARALADEVGFKDKDGNWIYPPNDGFSAKPIKTQVHPPATIDRYGGFYKDGSFEDYGNFVSNAGASFASRALPPGTMTKPFKTYEVLHPFEALSGKATPWFNQPGGGIQYMTEHKIGKLIELGYIREVK